MPKPTRKTLPKDFDAMLERRSLDELKAVFDKSILNATGGYSKKVALAFGEAPEELIRWLVEQGADLEAGDTYGKRPLQAHAGDWRGKPGLLLDLGADIEGASNDGNTALHYAADSEKNGLLPGLEEGFTESEVEVETDRLRLADLGFDSLTYPKGLGYGAPVYFSSTGKLPAPLLPDKPYYIVPAAGGGYRVFPAAT